MSQEQAPSHFSEIETLAILALSPEQAHKATEQDVEAIFEIGPDYVPHESLRILCARFPQLMFLYAIAIPENVLRTTCCQFPAMSLMAGFSQHLPSEVAKDILRQAPEKLHYLSEAQGEALVDDALVQEMIRKDALSVLRFGAQWAPRKVLAEIGDHVYQRLAAANGHEMSLWSSYALTGPSQPDLHNLKNYNFRLFSCPLGQQGQGWQQGMSVDLTNIMESGHVRLHNSSERQRFLVEAVGYSIEGVDEALAAQIAKSCVFCWDFLQIQIRVAVLSDFYRFGNDYRSGAWMYPKLTNIEIAERGDTTTIAETSPILLSSNTTFGVLLQFGSEAPVIPKIKGDIPYIRITLFGRPVPERLQSGQNIPGFQLPYI